MRRLTARQRELLVVMRAMGRIETRTVRKLFGYADPGRACVRLVERGLARKVKRGVYAPVVLRERTLAYDSRDGDESAG